MKKTLSLIALLTVLAMTAAALLPGCATAPPTQAPTQAVVEPTTEPTPEPPPEPYTLRIPVFDRGNPELPPVDDNYWTKWVQENFGTPNNITVEYVPILRSDTMGTYNTLIAAGDAPDILMEYDYPKLMAFYGMGALMEITDDLLGLAPGYKAFIGDQVMSYGIVEGKQMMLPALRPTAYNFMTLIRQDWLEQVGLPVPTDRDSYVAALQAFKDNIPGCIPSTLVMPQAYYGAYNFRDYPLSEEELALYSDVNVCALTWEPVKKSLKWQNELYNRGLVSPEFYLDLDGKKAQADFTSGKAGTYSMYLSVDPPVLQTLMQNVPTAKVAYLPASSGFAKGDTVTGRLYWNFGMLVGIYSKCKHPEGIMKLLEWMSGKDVLFTLQNGFEGKHYDLVDGLPAAKPYDGEERFNYNSNKDMWCLVIEGKDYGSEEANLRVQKNTFAPPGFEYLIEDSYKDYKSYEKTMYPDFLFSKALESAAENANLQSKWQEIFTVLLTCKPEEFEAKYAAACQEYLEAGFQKVLDEKRQVYNEMRGK